MSQPRLTTEEFENAISTLIASTSEDTSSRTRFDDDVFDKVSNLLACVERQDWSLRPRTYVLLRMINRPDYMHHFIHHGLRDIHLPYHQKWLPSFLDDVSRHMFMEKQRAVLTKANDLELENGRHRHFGASADRYFHILGTLGSGMFGVVDHVQSKLSINRFARKRIYRARSAIRGKEATMSFENELESLKRLRHQHLVTYIGSYTDPHYVGILTIPVADYDLQRFLQRTPFPTNEISLLRQFFGCLCSAVQYLHCNKCRHKDIKPGNILVKNGQVYLTDFGTARDWSEHTTGTTVGRSGPYTPRFTAPEVVNWEPRNQSADIWSLGCVYLDMLVCKAKASCRASLQSQKLIKDQTVIKGKTVNEMTEFFSKLGSGGISPQNNRQALGLWLNQLKTDRQDNEPIQWITQMLNPVRSNRPSAELLLEMIFGYEDEHVYYGICCSTFEESNLDNAYDGSELLDETDSESAFSAVPPLPPRAEEQHDGSRTGDPQDEEDPYLARARGHGSQDKLRKATRSAGAEYDEGPRRPTLDKADSSPAALKQTLSGEAQRSVTVNRYDTRREREVTQSLSKICWVETAPTPTSKLRTDMALSLSEICRVETAPTPTSKLRTDMALSLSKICRVETAPTPKVAHHEERP